MREDYYAGLEDRYFLTFDQAKESKLEIDFDTTPPAPAPKKLGLTVIDDVTIADVVPYIDWVRPTMYSSSHDCDIQSVRLLHALSHSHRTLSFKLGNCEAAIQIAVTPRFSMTKLSERKQKSSLMTHKSCSRRLSPMAA